MQTQRLIRGATHSCVVCIVALSAFQSATATNFTWTQSGGCGLFSCDFFNPIYWSPAGGPPGSGDFATIDMTGPVHLTENTEVLDNLTLNTSTTFRTFDNRLNVTGTPGNLFMFGLGFNGSTTLTVDGAGGFDVLADTISLHQGSELFLRGGRVLARFRMLISRSSLISGNGDLVANADAVGGVFEFAGTVRPSNGELSITAIDLASSHDLDGNIAGEEPGFLDITSTGDLYVSGTQADPFSGRIDIGNNRLIDANTPWSIDGDLTFTTAGNNRLVGPSFAFLSGAEVTTNQTTGRIEGESTWSSGAVTTLTDAADLLVLAGDSEIESGAVFSGDGQLVNTPGSTMTLADGAEVGVGVFNQGVVVVGNSPGSATLGDFTHEAAGALSIELGGADLGQFDSLRILGDAELEGSLDVTLLGGFALETDQRFTILDIDGAASGEFAGLPEGATLATPGEELFITYAGGDGNDVELFTAFDAFPGDFDGDGDVDGADYLKWQRGESPNPLSQTDLTDWEMNFGTILTAAAVPEPGGALLGLISALAMLVWRQGMKRRQATA